MIFEKNGDFSNFFFFERKNAFLGYKKKKFKKSKNWHFSKGVNPWFWYINGHFSNFFFWLYRPGKCLLWYSTLKNSFPRYKNVKFKQSKNWHFSKGANPWFWSKNGHFCNFFFLGNIRQENVFYDILERRNAFLGYKNKKLKKSKNLHFSKEVNPLFSYKNGHFSNLSFTQYGPGKCLLWYSAMKNRSGLPVILV